MKNPKAKRSSALAHYYKQARDWQKSIANDGGGSLTIYPSGKTELSYGSAAYQCHALAAFASARRSIAFRGDLRATIKQNARRSKAAKKGWQTRKAAAA
jgi:hypothetical protein